MLQRTSAPVLIPLCALFAAVGSRPVTAGPSLVAAPQNYVPPDYIRRPPTLPPHWKNRTARPITLSEAIALCLRKHLGLALQREQVRMIDVSRSLALGSFEPMLGITANRTASQSPPTTSLDGRPGQLVESTYDVWNLNLNQRLPTGTSLNLSWNNSRT